MLCTTKNNALYKYEEIMQKYVDPLYIYFKKETRVLYW